MLASCVIGSGGGSLDSMLSQFGLMAQHWQNTINPITQKIFFILFSMEFMWQLAVNKVFAGDAERLWVFFFTRTILCFFFAKYIINVNLYMGIINYLVNLSNSITGVNINITPGSYANTLGPSQIINSFFCPFDALHQMVDGTGSMTYIPVKFLLALLAIVIFISLSIMAFLLIKVIVQSYFVLYIGFILSGFAGSSWTMPYFQRYTYALSAAILELMAMSFILSIFYQQLQQCMSILSNANGIAATAGGFIHFAGDTFILSLLSWSLLPWVSHKLAGHIHLKFANVMNSASAAFSGH